MKKHVLTTLLLLTVCLFSACSDDVEYRIDPGLNSGTALEPVDPVTAYLNSRSGGLIVSDSEYDYFQYKEANSVVLYRRDRNTGTLTTLAERPWIDFGGDVMFTNLFLKDGYLYFLLFDGNEGLRNVWCRVPADGSAAYEQIYPFDWHFYSMFSDSGQVYVSLIGADNCTHLYTFTVETGECTPVDVTFDTVVNPMFTVDGYLYYEEVDGTGSETVTRLYRCQSGSSVPETVWDRSETNNILSAVSGGKLYVYSFATHTFYEADPDGSNARVLLEDVPVEKLNVHNGVFYFLMSGQNYADGLYRYVPGDRFVTPLYGVSSGVVTGPFITGDGNVWFTVHDELVYTYNLGNLRFVDRSGEYHTLK